MMVVVNVRQLLLLKASIHHQPHYRSSSKPAVASDSLDKGRAESRPESLEEHDDLRDDNLRDDLRDSCATEAARFCAAWPPCSTRATTACLRFLARRAPRFLASRQ